jgi:LysR family glycine cleavage system transcriptional activator
MTRRLPPLNALRAFEVAARHNSFTAAASELNVSHAAISRHVHALEARLNVALFHRTKRGIELTSAGADYLSTVSAAFDAIAQATDGLANPAMAQVRVSAHPAFATRWLLHHLDHFRDAYPGYEVALDATPSLVDLARDEADLAICNGEIDDGSVTQDLLARSRLYPVCAPGLLAGRRRFAPDQISQFVLLHDEEDGSSWRRWLDAAGVDGVDVRCGPRFLESGLAIEAAIAGQGVALADDFLVADDIAAGRLVQLGDIALAAADCNYYLRSLEDTRRRRPVAAFRTWLLDESVALRQPT